MPGQCSTSRATATLALFSPSGRARSCSARERRCSSVFRWACPQSLLVAENPHDLRFVDRNTAVDLQEQWYSILGLNQWKRARQVDNDAQRGGSDAGRKISADRGKNN